MPDATDRGDDMPGPPLIAVVDDDPAIRKMMGFLLPNAGYRVALWRQAAGAAGLIERERPDLVILDLRMEHLRAGMDVVRALRGRRTTERIPILVVSAWADNLTADEHGEIAAAHGDTMTKPFELADLLAKVATMVASRT